MRNVRIIYLLSYLFKSYFWLGIWVIYYLRFTNYAGIGLIESVMIATLVIFEIPTGAVADLFGKKKTMMMAFGLSAIGNFVMGMANYYSVLLFSVFLLSIADALASGTSEALMFDSLKEEQKEGQYDKVISTANSVGFIALAISGVVGGFLYAWFPGLPFIVVGVFQMIGMIVCFLLREPAVDTEKFSLPVYFSQTKQGFVQLFGDKLVRKQTLLLLLSGFIIVITFEVLDGILFVEYGYQEKMLGILATVTSLVAAGASQLAPSLFRRSKALWGVFLTGVLISISLLVSPFVGMIIGVGMVMFRNSLYAIRNNLVSVVINRNTESKYRATTLSTFSMLVSIPYILGAYGVGYFMDFVTARVFAMYLGGVLLVVLGWWVVRYRSLSLGKNVSDLII